MNTFAIICELAEINPYRTLGLKRIVQKENAITISKILIIHKNLLY